MENDVPGPLGVTIGRQLNDAVMFVLVFGFALGSYFVESAISWIGNRAAKSCRNTQTTFDATAAFTTIGPWWTMPSNPQYPSVRSRSSEIATGHPGCHVPARFDDASSAGIVWIVPWKTGGPAGLGDAGDAGELDG